MPFSRKLLIAIVLMLSTSLLLGGPGHGPTPVYAQDEAPTPTATPAEITRKTTLTVTFTETEWWLARWSDNDIACRMYVEHEGQPTQDEILTACGQTIFNEWQKTTQCNEASSDCKGYYLYPLTSYEGTRQVEVELPQPAVWLSIAGCELQFPQNTCNAVPQLVLTGEEPLPNESIIRINGSVNGQPFSCQSDSCILPLQPTGERGLTLEFWADSSFGDSSPTYSAQLRILPKGDFMSPDQASSDAPLYYVDVISSQWRGGPTASCADTWQVFPEVGGPPAWLTTPANAAELGSTKAFYYLAGALITNGEVDAAGCEGGGLEAPYLANACGLEKARPQLETWQNQFDAEIWQVARDTGVPAMLMKNMFSRESQLWPGIYESYKEAGLGQLTEKGADTVLLWNPSFFDQFCPLVLDQSVCDLGFGNLGQNEQNMLRGALVSKVNAACENCPMGIDLSQAAFSVRVFAEGLVANCEQVGRTISNITEYRPGDIASYTDLWRFTLVNYNAGVGCLAHAINAAWQSGQPLTWDNVSANLEPVCQSAVDYIGDITGMQPIVPTPTSWVFQGTPLPQVTPANYRTPTPSAVQPTPQPGAVTPTPTPSGYNGGPTPTLSGYPGAVTPYPTSPTVTYP
ncbi:hypothetical protein LARV_00036 [Longilinea arvoryzae]|uniref:Uncharacterized protein n=1 Tax=Longilinea arvoryzae TaxID=360412 RepID=A0A0S7BC06_9CHLR|nr:hypothetical protein [Longilinea arvoryzae]GAP12304.1 hypothetical protein LARV_00036 [Longilinea arvoryzae]